MCELTMAPKRDYTLTEELLGLSAYQDLFSTFGGRHFSFHRPTLEAFIRCAGSKKEKVYRRAARIMGNVFSTLAIETLDSAELCSTVSDIVLEVEKQLGAEKATDAKKQAGTKKNSG